VFHGFSQIFTVLKRLSSSKTAADKKFKTLSHGWERLAKKMPM
jgi:hypothetical protein